MKMLREMIASGDFDWDFLDNHDFTGSEILLTFLEINRKPIPREEQAREFWRVIEIAVEDLDTALIEELEAASECRYCHGSGGGYMGGRDPVCPFCRGTGRSAA